MRIAIVGAGISGLLAARLLSRRHDVTVFEAGGYAGGHTNTVVVDAGGERHAVGTGFIVLNHKTYPNFSRLLDQLGVASMPTTMSFSVRCERTALEYNGTSLNALYAQRRNLLAPSFHGMVRDILRYNRRGAAQAAAMGNATVGEFLAAHDYGARFRDHYLVPMGAAIWSAPPRAFRRLAAGGALGAAEAYLRGEWTADDLPAALRIFAANLDAADRLESPATRVVNLAATAAHRLRRNSRRGSRRNIRDHYDLGNDFFALFLDETMTYSSAIFERPDATLREASTAKLDRVCRKLELSPSDHVLEIGTGWGSFARHAASRYGCRVTTTTISEAQHRIASKRIAAAGLAGRVTLLRRDYRDLSGRFSKVASIEMVEAVGPQYLHEYFGLCSRLLARDGLMLLQGIVMPEHRVRSYLGSVDVIQRYVFPGSALTSVGAMAEAIGRTTDFRIAHLEDLSAHYARTLRRWRGRFLDRVAEVRALGYDERFIRLWDYYLSYCEAGFAERCTGVVQMLLAKPGSRRVLPLSGGWQTEPLQVAS